MYEVPNVEMVTETAFPAWLETSTVGLATASTQSTIAAMQELRRVVIDP